MNLHEHAQKIEDAVLSTIAEGKTITGDLGGKASTSEFAAAVISRIQA